MFGHDLCLSQFAGICSVDGPFDCFRMTDYHWQDYLVDSRLIDSFQL